MKKALIITAILLAFLLLALSNFKEYVTGIRDERFWYIQKLNYEFSGEVDSIRLTEDSPDHIVFHITHGTPDLSIEEKLGKELKHFGKLRLLTLKSNQVIEMEYNANMIRTGDSLAISTKNDRIAFYRNGNFVLENEVRNFLQASPF